MSGRHPLDVAALRQIEAFAGTSTQVLAALLSLSPAVEFAAGERLMHQSDADDFALIILAGEVDIVSERLHGQSSIARLPGPVLVGEIAALTGLPRTASVVAATEVRALRAPRDALILACRESPDILMSLIGKLGHNLESVNHALGLYAGGCAALERGDLDPSILSDLTHPSQEARGFADAFQRLARHIALERRNREEMASAALIQRAMLPEGLERLPLRGRCDVFGDMRAARDVGGDFYDVFMVSDDHLAVIIGDVCGKGVPASLFMSQTMTTLRIAARQHDSLAGMLKSANAALCAYNPSLMFATAFCGILDLEDGGFEYANCGHCRPFVLRRGGMRERLAGGGPPLGVVAGASMATHTIGLAPGEGAFLFTDGVTESIDPGGTDYGEDRLDAILGRNASASPAASPAQLSRAVMEDVARFAGGADPFDDVTCLALTR